MQLTASIPLKDIKKIEIYQNVSRLYMKRIKEQTGADYIINGTIYNPSKFTPYGNTKANGKTLYDPGYTEYGYAWDNGSDITYKVLPISAYKNHIGCVALTEHENLIYNEEMGNERQRSCMGLKNGNLMLYCCNGADSKTPEALKTYVFNNGWDNAIMLDGGGSTQCIFNNNTLSSSENYGNGRIVQNYILVYLNKTENNIDGDDIINISKTGIVNAGSGLNVRSSPSINPYNKLGVLVNKTKIVITGITNDNKWYRINYNNRNGFVSTNYIKDLADITIVKETCPYKFPSYTIKKGSTGIGVKWLQWNLNHIIDTRLDIDGSFGPATLSALKSFQSMYKLEVDGSCGPATKAKIKELSK